MSFKFLIISSWCHSRAFACLHGLQLEVEGLKDLEESKEHESYVLAGDLASPVDAKIEADLSIFIC